MLPLLNNTRIRTVGRSANQPIKIKKLFSFLCVGGEICHALMLEHLEHCLKFPAWENHKKNTNFVPILMKLTEHISKFKKKDIPVNGVNYQF